MEKLSSLSILSAVTKLDGEVESDEFYIKAGLKSRSYHDEIVKVGRPPEKEDYSHGEAEVRLIKTIL